MSEMPVMDPEVTDWSIILGYRGSHAYGTAQEGSDRDLMAVSVPPFKYYMGLEQFGRQGTAEFKRDEWDIVAYECRKFVRVLMGGSVDALAVLWLPQDKYLKVTDAGRMLIDNRKVFMSRQLFMTGDGFVREAVRKYFAAKDKAETYKAKDAYQHIRAIRFITEILGFGEAQVERHDADELIAIKNGKWSLEDVYGEIQGLKSAMQVAYVKSPLPESIDIDAASELCVQVIQAAWEARVVR